MEEVKTYTVKATPETMRLVKHALIEHAAQLFGDLFHADEGTATAGERLEQANRGVASLRNALAAVEMAIKEVA